eukprot:741925_1
MNPYNNGRYQQQGQLQGGYPQQQQPPPPQPYTSYPPANGYHAPSQHMNHLCIGGMPHLIQNNRSKLLLNLDKYKKLEDDEATKEEVDHKKAINLAEQRGI